MTSLPTRTRMNNRHHRHLPNHSSRMDTRRLLGAEGFLVASLRPLTSATFQTCRLIRIPSD